MLLIKPSFPAVISDNRSVLRAIGIDSTTITSLSSDGIVEKFSDNKFRWRLCVLLAFSWLVRRYQLASPGLLKSPTTRMQFGGKFSGRRIGSRFSLARILGCEIFGISGFSPGIEFSNRVLRNCSGWGLRFSVWRTILSGRVLSRACAINVFILQAWR